jgi:hypothetical protein
MGRFKGEAGASPALSRNCQLAFRLIKWFSDEASNQPGRPPRLGSPSFADRGGERRLSLGIPTPVLYGRGFSSETRSQITGEQEEYTLEAHIAFLAYHNLAVLQSGPGQLHIPITSGDQST